ncbi:glycine cleavage system transcriptional activator [Klebsiella pneumoniae]|uniref:Glycine cleavage system transcriptional activator n=1 Tax=Klebsiella pneumoniae TaxID=573 RepID=A0A377TQ33_KLEPN|nr:glycine cleavage system transcriptional activator [Klebsiella pneumoniae]
MADFPPVASLRSFEAVARLGSVTQAAHELSVTHSAVSQHIKQLEALVGVTLFIRHGRGVRITEEGRLYALQIREALQHIADATRMVQINPAPWKCPWRRSPPLAATGCCAAGALSGAASADRGAPADQPGGG